MLAGGDALAVAAVQAALRLGLVLAAVPVLAVVAVGLGVSIVQAVTQLQDTSLAFVPKLVVAALVLFIAGPWMLTLLSQFAQGLWIRGGIGG
jgi:flagellar biosynthetic protein FliQ